MVSAVDVGRGEIFRPDTPGLCVMALLRSCAFAAAAAVALAAAPACAQIRWSLPSAYPAENFHSENLVAFAHDIADATGGKLAITVHPNAALFPAPAIKSAVRIGQAQMGEVLLSIGNGLFYDEEVPREGARVTRQRRLARWTDGSTWLWTSFKNEVGQGEGSSQLKFDQIVPL